MLAHHALLFLALAAAAAPPQPQHTRPEAGAPAARPASASEIERLIAQLGSGRHAEREQAAAALVKAGRKALPFLEKAADAKDPEVQRRAKAVQQKVLMQVVQALVGDGVDQFAERLLLKGRNASEEDWANLLLVAQAVSSLNPHPRTRGPWRVDKLVDKLMRKPVLTDGFKKDAVFSRDRVVAGRVIPVKDAVASVIVCEGAGAIRRMDKSVLFVQGDLRITVELLDCIVICDGDILVDDTHAVGNCVLLARGAVRLRRANMCVVGAGGPVSVAGGFGGTIRAGGLVTVESLGGSVETAAEAKIGRQTKTSTVNANQKGLAPLGGFRFFDPARLGIETAAADGSLRVSKVQAGTPFARAGLKAGDVLVELDKVRVASPDEFRRGLRRGTVVGHATFSVRRGGELHEVKVNLADR
jgi:PDZ domain